MRLKESYALAKCCSPSRDNQIVGYYSHDNYLKVHRHDCPNLSKAERERLVPLEWKDIVTEPDLTPGGDYDELTSVDFAVLAHHEKYGIDYSLKVARILHVPQEEVFDRHRRLRQLELLRRVEPRIVQYRRGIVDNKWIKHRNHTYYELTEKGRVYIGHYRAGKTR